jgi:hypothetical protein
MPRASSTVEGIPEKDKEEGPVTGKAICLYKISRIRERYGTLPIWFELVAYVLMIWGLYCSIRD